MIVTFGFDKELDRFVPTHEPSMAHEGWVDADLKLPKYISKDFFINNYYKLTFISRYGLNFELLKSEDELRKILTLSGSDLYNAVQLLTTKKKTAFITSTKASLRKWIKGELDYQHPWSGKQAKALDALFSKNFKAHFALIQRNVNPISSFT